MLAAVWLIELARGQQLCANISLVQNNWQPQPVGEYPGCSEGQALSSGETCLVLCQAGYYERDAQSFSTEVSCAAGAVEGAAVSGGPSCVRTSCAAVNLQAHRWVPLAAGGSPCRDGQVLTSGDTCTVSCQAGYGVPGAQNLSPVVCASDAIQGAALSGAVECVETVCAPIQFDLAVLSDSPRDDIVASGWVGGDVNPCTNGMILRTASTSSCAIACNTTTHVEQQGTIACTFNSQDFRQGTAFACEPKRCEAVTDPEAFEGWKMAYTPGVCAQRVAGQFCPHQCLRGFENGEIVCGFDGSFVVSPCTALVCSLFDWDLSIDGVAPSNVESCPNGCPAECPAGGCVSGQLLPVSAQPINCVHHYTRAEETSFVCTETDGTAKLSTEPCRPTVCSAINWTAWETFHLRANPVGQPSSGTAAGEYAHGVSIGTNQAHLFSQQYPAFECAIGYEVDSTVTPICDGDGLVAEFSETTGPCGPLTCSSLSWQYGVTSWSDEQEPNLPHQRSSAAANALVNGDNVTLAEAQTGRFVTGTEITVELLNSSVQGTFACAHGYSVQPGVILNCQATDAAAVFSGQPCRQTGCLWSISLPVLQAAHIIHSNPVASTMVTVSELGELLCEPGYIQESAAVGPWGVCSEAGAAFEFGGCTEIRCNPLSLAGLPRGATAIIEERHPNGTKCVDGSVLSRRTNQSCMVTCMAGWRLLTSAVVTCESDAQGLDPTVPIECEQCAQGTYSPGLWKTCVKCHGAEIDHDADPATPCVRYDLCPAGQEIVPGIRSYVSQDEELHSTRNRPGYSTNDDCQPCAAGRYRMSADRAGCVDPGKGLVCPYEGMAQPLPAADYYLSQSSLLELAQELPEDRVPAMCVPAEACLGGKIGVPQSTGATAWARESCEEQMRSPSDPEAIAPIVFAGHTVLDPGECTGVCKVGYERDRCSMCTQGFKRNLDECELCPTQPLSLRWLIVVVLVLALTAGLVAVAIVRWLSGYVSTMRELATPALILVTFAQTLSSMLALQMHWPPFVKRLFKMLSVLNVSLEFADPECSFEFTFMRKLIFALSLPAITIMIGKVYIVVYSGCLKHQARPGKATENAQADSEDVVEDTKVLHEALQGHNIALTSVRTMWVTSFNLLSIFFTTTMLQAFDCQPVREGDTSEFLVVEPVVACELYRTVTTCTGTAKPVASRSARCVRNESFQPLVEDSSPPSPFSSETLPFNSTRTTNVTEPNGTSTDVLSAISAAPAMATAGTDALLQPMTSFECAREFQLNAFNSSGCPAGPCVFVPVGTNSTAICAETYEAASQCPDGCTIKENVEVTEYFWIYQLARLGTVLYVLSFFAFYRGLVGNRKGFEDLLDQMKPGFVRFQLWMMIKKLVITFVANFGSDDVARGWFLTNMVVSAALVLQIWFRPYASAAANACETLALAATLVVVTCGATFRQEAMESDAAQSISDGEVDQNMLLSGATAIGAERDMEAMASDLDKASKPFFSLMYDVKDSFAHTKFLGEHWYLVRYVPGTREGCWHTSSDKLEGTDQYGPIDDQGHYPADDPLGGTSELSALGLRDAFSVPFYRFDYTEILLTSGDATMWAVLPRTTVDSCAMSDLTDDQIQSWATPTQQVRHNQILRCF